MEKYRIPGIFRGLILIATLVASSCTLSSTPSPEAYMPAVFYVSTAGSDANDCLSPAYPCLSIDGAIMKGGTEAPEIHVSPGTYTFPEQILSANPGDVGGDVGVIDRNISVIADESGVNFSPLLVTSIEGNIQVKLEGITIPNRVTVSEGATLTLLEVTIRDSAGMNVIEAGIENSGTVVLQNSVVTNNNIGLQNNGTALIQGSRIVENIGGLPDSSGGVVNSGSMSIIDSTIDGNEAATGAGIQNRQGEITIERSTISHNRSTSTEGGRAMAVYNAAGGTITIRNTTISGNSSIAGGDSAIINFGLLNISFSTIAENDGLGIQTGAQAGTASQITIDNSIVANNAERDCYWPALIDATWSSAHILSDGSCETSGVFERPAVSEMFLGDLAENGGPTQTHALLEGSLAIDAAEGDCPATDQRGASRPMGSECDLGAFEYGD